MKEGILAARERLRKEDRPRERREDELKQSILNARMGLKRAESGTRTFAVGLRTRETTPVEARGTTPVEREKSPVAERERTPVVMRDTTPVDAVAETVVKVEDVDEPRDTTPVVKVEVEEEDVPVKVEMETPPVAKVKPAPEPTRQPSLKPIEQAKITTPPILKVYPTSVPTKKKSIEAMSFTPHKPSSTTPKPQTPQTQKVEPSSVSKPTSRTVSASSTTPSIKDKSPPQSTTLPPTIEQTPPKPAPKPTLPKSAEKSPPKMTSLAVQKPELDPAIERRISATSSPKKDNDSPTPQKKFPRSADAMSLDPETPVKSPEPTKATLSPLAPSKPAAPSSVKGFLSQFSFNCRIAGESI